MDRCQTCRKRFAAATYRRRFCDVRCRARYAREREGAGGRPGLGAVALAVELARTAPKGRRGS